MVKLIAVSTMVLGLAAAPAFAGGKVLTNDQLDKVTAGASTSLSASCSGNCFVSATATNGVLGAYTIVGGTLFFNGQQVF